MDSKQDTLNQVSSHTILVYPPEILLGGEWFCRFEPDGIATIKGFLEQKGYGLVELVYSSLKPGDGKKKTCFQNSVGWGISSVDQEGLSFRGIIDSALNLSLDSPIALSLKDFLPLTYLSNTRVVGFSIGFPSQLYHSLVLARLIKQLKHDVFVVLGGPLITSYITFVASLHEMGSCVDGIIAGFGEEPLAQLILTLDKKQELKFVPNLRLWTSNGFQLNPVRWTPDRTCLRTVPDYARSTLMREIDPYFPIRPSIGCYWGKCAFCVYPSMSTGTREKRPYVALNPKELVDHIRLLMTKGSGDISSDQWTVGLGSEMDRANQDERLANT